MAELVEYSLAILVSGLFIAGSVTVYWNYSSFESGLSLRAEFEAVLETATQAVQSGDASATLSVPSSTVSCAGGLLSVEVGGRSQNGTLPVGCAFTLAVPSGVHDFEFRDDSSRLGLVVA